MTAAAVTVGGEWMAVPLALLNDPDRTGFLVWCYVRHRNRNDSKGRPRRCITTLNSLARLFAVCPRHMRRVVTDLEEAGCLELVSRGEKPRTDLPLLELHPGRNPAPKGKQASDMNVTLPEGTRDIHVTQMRASVGHECHELGAAPYRSLADSGVPDLAEETAAAEAPPHTHEPDQDAHPLPAAAVSDAETAPEGRGDPWDVAEASLADEGLAPDAPRLGMTLKQREECLAAAEKAGRSPEWVAAICEKARKEGRVPGALARRLILDGAEVEIPGAAGSEQRHIEEKRAGPAPPTPEETARRLYLGRMRVVEANTEKVARHLLGPLVSDEEFAALQAEKDREAPRPKAVTSGGADPLTEMLRGAFPSMPAAAPAREQDPAFLAQKRAIEAELRDRRKGATP